jgi:5S rRNA maturation endonuclease (ribonuclease M5)
MRNFNDKEVEYIQNRANERITEILDAIGVEYQERGDYLSAKCPCHDGDNPRSFYWAIRTNHWKCNTKHCEADKISGNSSSVFGLIRGAMANKTQQKWYFNQSVIFATKVLGLSDIKFNRSTKEELEIDKIIKQYKKKKNNIIDSNFIPLSEITINLKKDNLYYVNRGVTDDIINKYHISYCDNKNKRFYKRAFFPILDPTGKFVVGFSARSIYEECLKCEYYHNPNFSCPSKEKRHLYVKWIHSKGFKSEKVLYNYWYAKYHISKSGTAIICEGPGNVWACEMAGLNNSVAIMGSSMSKYQRQLLQKAGALTLIIPYDNDNAGMKLKDKLIKELNYYFRIIPIDINNVNDIAEMNKNDIINKIGSVLKNESKEFLFVDN